jgi:HlyD family secretion protein
VRQVRLTAKTEQNVVTYNVVVDVANPDLALMPGMTANLRVQVETRRNVLRVPTAALRFRPKSMCHRGRRKPRGGGAMLVEARRCGCGQDRHQRQGLHRDRAAS